MPGKCTGRLRKMDKYTIQTIERLIEDINVELELDMEDLDYDFFDKVKRLIKEVETLKKAYQERCSDG